MWYCLKMTDRKKTSDLDKILAVIAVIVIYWLLNIWLGHFWSIITILSVIIPQQIYYRIKHGEWERNIK